MGHRFFHKKEPTMFTPKIASELKNLNKIDIKKQIKRTLGDPQNKDGPLSGKHQPVLTSGKLVKKFKTTALSKDEIRSRLIKNSEGNSNF
jgi:hypothetical protein